ncbi:MAG: DUF116 domain-containing protein [Firmicutes bacterium]|nr:DUF116 domain-containing protein [Bacillota bacterium]
MPTDPRTPTERPETVLFLSLVGLAMIATFVGVARHLGTLWRLISSMMLVATGVLFLGLVGLYLSLKGKTIQGWLLRLSEAAVDILYPIALRARYLFGLSRDVVQRSYISVRNMVTKSQSKTVKPSQVLVLVPHCLQWSECTVRITSKVSNCRRCGRCAIGNLLAMQERLGFALYVASGGTAARRAVKEVRPRAIVGVACERDLVSGMQDMRGISVLGVTNERPNGPCFNTDIDVVQVEEAVLSLLNAKEES